MDKLLQEGKKVFFTKFIYKIFCGIGICFLGIGLFIEFQKKLTLRAYDGGNCLDFLFSYGPFLTFFLIVIFLVFYFFNLVYLKIEVSQNGFDLDTRLPKFLNIFRIPKIFRLKIPSRVNWSDIVGVEYHLTIITSLLRVKTRTGNSIVISMVSFQFNVDQLIRSMSSYLSLDVFNQNAKNFIVSEINEE